MYSMKAYFKFIFFILIFIIGCSEGVSGGKKLKNSWSLNGPIKNPYHTESTWKLWAIDPSPVNFENNSYSIATSEADRLFPTLKQADNFLALGKDDSEASGFWDDAYGTDDSGHSMLPTSWKRGGYSIDLKGQYLRFGSEVSTYGGSPMTNDILGLNFTSQSTTCEGHDQVQSIEVEMNEKTRYFSNNLRGVIAIFSYMDTKKDRAIDSYQTIPAFGYHSFGRSSSEVHGLFKMMVSGGYLHRGLKDYVKYHGIYPATLLYIFKANLPYAYYDGKPVEYTNELLHRVAYLSDGDSDSSEFMPYNKWYHKYDEVSHLKNMTKFASEMEVAPPVAILKFVNGTTVAKNGITSNMAAITTSHTWVKAKTTISIPFAPGDTVSVDIDVGESYDLDDYPLTYKWTVLYPEQKNVSIEKKDKTIYTIKMTYDQKLPKGRIPILLTVNNGKHDSHPAVVSFYPSNSSTNCDNYERGNNPEKEVNVNLRPLLKSSVSSPLTVKAGETAKFKLTCSDPEGFNTTIYRWANERGTLDADYNFTLNTESSDSGKTIPLHFICSDGTGGYNSMQQIIKVN